MTLAPQPLRPSRSAGGRSYPTFRTVVALILREMSTRYGRTPGGYLWAVLEPLGGILILSIGFSLILRSPPLGTSFVLFYATGFVPFTLYNTLANSTATAINFSKPLLRYPAVSWVDAVLARFTLNAITGLVVMVLLLGSILLLADTRIMVEVLPVLEAIALVMLLGLGIGMINCALIGLFPLWEMIWSILTRPLFLASGIFFLYESMPPLAQEILWYNPLIHLIGLLRSGFYPTYEAAYVSHAYVAGFSLVALAFGLLLMGRFHREILNR